MNVCYICHEYPPALHGGIGSVVRASARALVARGHNVRVLGTYAPNMDGAGYEEDEGVRIWRLAARTRKLGWIADRWELFRTVQAWVEEGLIDVIEVPDWEGHACGWPRLAVPVVTRLHGSTTYFAREMGGRERRLMNWLERRSYHRSDFCSSCSTYTAEKTTALFGHHRRQTQVIYNSVRMEPLVTAKRLRNTVIFAGTLVKKKGIEQLIRAWSSVHRQRPEAQLHIYGKDAGALHGRPLIPQLQAQLSQSANASVHFHGHIPIADLRALYRSCGMAIFPSYAEAFAMAPMEAMVEGCPVIVSSRTSGPELVEDGVNGLLVDPDNLTAIETAIIRLLDDSALADQLGAAGRLTIDQRFRVRDMAEHLEDYYGKCIRTFSRPVDARTGTAETRG